MAIINPFSVQGSRYEDPEMVVRRAQTDRIKRDIEFNSPVLLLGPRQSGKSTLLKSIVREIKEEKARSSHTRDHPVVYFSLEHFSESEATEDAFFERLVTELFHEIGAEVPAALREYPDTIFEHFPYDTTIAFDEFSGAGKRYKKFFHNLRRVYDNHRSNGLKVVLADRTHASEFMDKTSSPFNIGTKHHLHDFSGPETDALLSLGFKKSGLACGHKDEGYLAINDHIWERTQGQPYLVQRIGGLVIERAESQGKKSITDTDGIEACKLFVTMGTDVHMQTMLRYVREEFGPIEARRMGRILLGHQEYFEEGGAIGKLYSYGFIKPTDEEFMSGNAVIRNPLYEAMLKRYTPELLATGRR